MQRTEAERSTVSILTHSPSFWLALTACLPIAILVVISMIHTCGEDVLLGMLVAGRLWPIALITLALWWIWCLFERLLPRTRRRSEKAGPRRHATVVAAVTAMISTTLILTTLPIMDVLDLDGAIPDILKNRDRFHELVTQAHPVGTSSAALEVWLHRNGFTIRTANDARNMQASIVGASLACNVRGWVNWTSDSDGRIETIYDQVTSACI